MLTSLTRTPDYLLLLSVYSPLVSFIMALFYERKGGVLPISILITGMTVAMVCGLVLMIFFPKPDTLFLYTWVEQTVLTVSIGIQKDSLSLLMIGVVNVVSWIVHIYSIGYMAHDARRNRFISYLSFFTFMMLFLVTAPNMVQLFFGWEGVGLVSYILIGFLNEKPNAPKAATKAFIVNRIGDAGLLLGIAFAYTFFGSLDFTVIQQLIEGHHDMVKYLPLPALPGVYDWMGLCFLVGIMGKSAQFGLHVWLADAMEGPTPVSALIHAATMVTAGIFLIAKLHYIFALAPFIQGMFFWCFPGRKWGVRKEFWRLVH